MEIKKSLYPDGDLNMLLLIQRDFVPYEWTYLYDHSPLVNNLEKYIHYNRLQPKGRPNARLIITAVNVLTSEPLIFDSSKQQITSKYILATTGYPRYYYRWMEVEKGILRLGWELA